jgi:hypothetical protein
MSLKNMSDRDVLSRTEALAEKERQVISELLGFLQEVDERKLYCDRGCGSLFQYCVKVLKYSEASAQRRIDAMRLNREIPEIKEKIETGELNLSVVSQAQTFFRNEAKISNSIGMESKKEILGRLSGKSRRESERELLSLSAQPEIHITDQTRSVSQTHTQVQFVANEEQMALFEKARGLLAHSSPNMSWAELFQKVTEIALQKIDPQRSVSPPRKLQDPRKRNANVGLRRELWKRDNGKCQKCGSQHALEIDHVIPWALGGETSEENLRLLCRSCNQRRAMRAQWANFSVQPSSSDQRA